MVTGGWVGGGEVAGGEVAGGEVAGGEVAGGEVAGGDVAGGEVATVTPPDRVTGAAIGAVVVVDGELDALAAGAAGVGVVVGDTTNQVPATPWPEVWPTFLSPANR